MDYCAQSSNSVHLFRLDLNHILCTNITKNERIGLSWFYIINTKLLVLEHILFGLLVVRKKFPNKKNVIVLDEGLIVSPDFLFYMAQLVFLLEKDDTILAIAAWNPNGKACYIFPNRNSYLFCWQGILIKFNTYSYGMAADQKNWVVLEFL